MFHIASFVYLQVNWDRTTCNVLRKQQLLNKIEMAWSLPKTVRRLVQFQLWQVCTYEKPKSFKIEKHNRRLVQTKKQETVWLSSHLLNWKSSLFGFGDKLDRNNGGFGVIIVCFGWNRKGADIKESFILSSSCVLTEMSKKFKTFTWTYLLLLMCVCIGFLTRCFYMNLLE